MSSMMPCNSNTSLLNEVVSYNPYFFQRNSPIFQLDRDDVALYLCRDDKHAALMVVYYTIFNRYAPHCVVMIAEWILCRNAVGKENRFLPFKLLTILENNKQLMSFFVDKNKLTQLEVNGVDGVDNWIRKVKNSYYGNHKICNLMRNPNIIGDSSFLRS